MLRKFFAFMICVAAAHSAIAATCVNDTYAVKYDCGIGTKRSLPADATVRYNTAFTPKMLSKSNCTEPDGGYVINGIEIWVNDEYKGAYTTNAVNFKYLYTSDMTIKPHYVNSAPENLYSLRAINGMGSWWNGGTRQWNVMFSYGVVSGVSACNEVAPGNTQDAWDTGWTEYGEQEHTGGKYCWCKMTSPQPKKTAWVYWGMRGSEDCEKNCASHCANDVRYGQYYRGAMFRLLRDDI